MAISVSAFNPVTLGKTTISMEMETAYVQGVQTFGVLPAPDFYVKISVSAKDKDGADVGPFYLTNLTDLPDGASKHDGDGTPFGSLTAQVENYLRHILEGDGGNTELDF